VEDSLMVLGSATLVALGLLAWLILVWLEYYQESSRLDSRETQLRHHCQANLEASEQARSRTAQALERCRALELDLPGLHHELTQLREAGKDKKE